MSGGCRICGRAVSQYAPRDLCDRCEWCGYNPQPAGQPVAVVVQRFEPLLGMGEGKGSVEGAKAGRA